MMTIFVGNLSFDSNENDVKKLFESFGNVTSVTIVMRKEIKAPKSRGFGFVQMPDDRQTLAAIAALNGKEFMGRVLDISLTRPKAKTQTESELKKKWQPEVAPKAELYLRKEREQKKTLFNPVFSKPGGYKGGRRSRSYMKRQGLAGLQVEAKPRQGSQSNPMRWRKKKDQVKPRQKSPGEHKPWKKPVGDAKPWSKGDGVRKNPDGYKR